MYIHAYIQCIFTYLYKHACIYIHVYNIAVYVGSSYFNIFSYMLCFIGENNHPMVSKFSNIFCEFM